MAENQGDEALWQQAVALTQARDLQGALAALDQLIAQKPDEVRGHYNRGVLLQHLGRSAEAAKAFRRVLALEPGHARATQALQALQPTVQPAPDPAPAAVANDPPPATQPSPPRSAAAQPASGPGLASAAPTGNPPKGDPSAAFAVARGAACPNHPDLPALVQCAHCKQRFCAHCVLVLRGMKYCAPCKQKVASQTAPSGPRETCKEAQQALMYALVGILPALGLILGPVAISKALHARRVIRISPQLEGSSQAMAAMLVGAIAFAANAAWLLLLVKGA